MPVQTLKVRYKDGALQLLDFVSIPEGEEIMIQVQTPNLPTIDADSRMWLEGTAQDMASRVDALEKELPNDKAEKWHKAMPRASKPARYVEGKGIVVESELPPYEWGDEGISKGKPVRYSPDAGFVVAV